MLQSILLLWPLRRTRDADVRSHVPSRSVGPALKAGGPPGDASTGDLPDLIGLLLPREPRAIWNLIVLAGAMLLLSIRHWLTARIVTTRTDWRDHLWYVVTLPWWLALVALVAFVWGRHRLAIRQEAAGS